jgi:hypothetical protein
MRNINPPSEKQRAVLEIIMANRPYEEIEAMTRDQASSLIAWHSEHWREYPATYHQETFLLRWDKWDPNMSRGDASYLIAKIKVATAGMTPAQISDEIAYARQLANLASNSLDSPAEVAKPDQVR